MLSITFAAMSTHIHIAIDGWSSCGKSTLARALARELDYLYVDSGAMYRAVTHYLIEQDIPINDENSVGAALPDIHIDFKWEAGAENQATYLNGRNVESAIRTMEVSKCVSPVSAIGAVRKALVAQQQQISSGRGVVMDGRDIGTVVFPNAELKIFLTADPEVRVQRRYDEMLEKGHRLSLEDIRLNLRERDHIDSTREESPLRKAADAILFNNSAINETQQLEWAVNLARQIMRY